MVYRPELLDALEQIGGSPLDVEVWRHMFNGLDPSRPNFRGARWNPRGVSAIYTSTTRETALSEAAYAISVQPVAPSTTRQLHRLHVTLSGVIDLSERALLAEFGVTEAELGSVNYSQCQDIGGAAQWLGHDGILVPSARTNVGNNLVIFPDNLDIDAVFEVVATEAISDG